MPRRTLLAVAALPLAAYVVLLVLVAALYVKPPVLGWIGLGVVGAVALPLAAGALVLFPRMSANVAPTAPARDAVLVVADSTCSTRTLCDGVAAHVGGRAARIHVVAPILASPLHYLSDDETVERADAQHRLDETLAQLRAAGLDATGSLGADDPLQALGDALAEFPADEVVLVTPPESHWLEAGLPEGAARLVPRIERLVAEPELVSA